MERVSSKYPIDEQDDVIGYIQHGYHTFVGCDDVGKRNQFVESLQVALDGSIQEQISCGDILERGEFDARIAVACRNFVGAVGISSLQRGVSGPNRRFTAVVIANNQGVTRNTLKNRMLRYDKSQPESGERSTHPRWFAVPMES